MYEPLNGFRIERGTLPSGDRGTRITLDRMRALARDGSKQLAVRETALNIVRAARVEPHDLLGELRALFEFVRDRVRFIRDIYGVETLQSPRYTLQVMAGDCDDRATLLSSLALAIGIPAQLTFKAIGADPRRPDRLSHVYVVARLGRQAVALDPTYQDSRLGWQYPRPSRTLEVAV